ncbi:MAG: hypothetical protein Q8O00_04345, partial [Holophaga sp.]|nr:hypothetical protein [Holophaga sp.]
MKRETRRGQDKVLSTVQDLLRDELDDGTGISITPELIAEKISIVVTMNPRWGEALDREALIDELIRRFSLWIGQDALLKNDADHQPWLNANRKKNWHYWKLYQEWLDIEMSPTTVDALDISTDMVLGLLEDPGREGPWDRRGLVNGHVQSGKTGHYTGLICKAADAGYKIIIVLAGLHKNLRSQTQVRLDEGFLGYETRPNSEELVPTGVGTLVGFDIASAPNFATNRSDNGDFNTALSRNLGISPEQRPWLFVVKKNKTPLKLLLRWIQQHVADAHSTTITGAAQDTNEIPRVKKISTKFSAIIIDDEADNASVDTGEASI